MTTPFWLDGPRAPRPALAGELRAEVAIVGGGVTGAAAARLLGPRAVLVERGAVGSGASGRNAGFLLAGGAQAYSMTARSFGREEAKRRRRFAVDNLRLVRERIEEDGIDCAYARNGSFTLAMSENEADALAKSATLLAQDGFKAEWVEDVGRRFPAGVRAALFNPDDAELDPARFVRGLAAAAERAGARVFESTPVLRVDATPSSVALTTPAGRLQADRLLLATNAWSGKVWTPLEDAIVPARAQMFATAPVRRGLIPAPCYADFGFEYFRQLPDGRVLAGGGRRAALTAEQTFEEAPSAPVQSAIERFFYSVYPEAAAAPVTHRWAGIMGFTADEWPLIGPCPGAPPSVLISAGYHGHGLGLALNAVKKCPSLF